MFTQKDRQQLAIIGITESQALQQIDNFRKGFPFSDLLKPATAGDGIIRLSLNEAGEMASLFDASSSGINILKFVPASGAATRMFKDIYSFWTDLASEATVDSLFAKYREAKQFFEQLDKFPFYEDLMKTIPVKLKSPAEKGDFKLILEHFLDEKGLSYGSLPKGLLKFHRYSDHTRTSMEEHWVEGASYAGSSASAVNVHFTISPNHEHKFKDLIAKHRKEYELKYGIKLNLSYSFQKPSTDVIAVDMQNEPFRESDGSLVFRPGGHGALLENLNDCNAELIFIKNVDNVVPDRLREETILYKKALAGIVLSYRNRIFDYIHRLENDSDIKLVQEVHAFVQNELYYIGLNDPSKIDKKHLLAILNRPIRACGMVKNEGEPGGGPFWVKDKQGNISLQVVESSQVDMSNPEQKAIFSQSTHFNPVDLVCYVKNYKGEKFNLVEFRDPDTGFITVKSKDGKSLKAQELPGLWNGAMAHWNTFFVEVPLITFNPVKTVNDLLRSNHI